MISPTCRTSPPDQDARPNWVSRTRLFGELDTCLGPAIHWFGLSAQSARLARSLAISSVFEGRKGRCSENDLNDLAWEAAARAARLSPNLSTEARERPEPNHSGTRIACSMACTFSLIAKGLDALAPLEYALLDLEVKGVLPREMSLITGIPYGILRSALSDVHRKISKMRCRHVPNPEETEVYEKHPTELSLVLSH